MGLHPFYRIGDVRTGARGQYAELLIDPDTRGAGLLSYVVAAEGYHPVWKQYLLVNIHLRPLPFTDPPTKHRRDVTHEFHLYAINPDHPLRLVTHEEVDKICVVEPMNFGYQLACENDASFLERTHSLAAMICSGTLSPDTRHNRVWARLFGDGVPLVVRL